MHRVKFYWFQSLSVPSPYLFSFPNMCPLSLLVFVSTLYIGMAMGGPHGPEGELISQNKHLASENPVHAVSTSMRRMRRENPCFTSLSTMAVAFIMGFLITRCFIAMSSSKKQEREIHSRRLASGADNICSVSIQQEDNGAHEKESCVLGCSAAGC